MTTLWILYTLLATGLGQPLSSYPTKEACQAQIASMPEQQRQSILGGKFTCEPFTVNQ